MWNKDKQKEIEALYEEVKRMDAARKLASIQGEATQERIEQKGLENAKETEFLRWIGRELLGGLTWVPASRQMFKNMPPHPTRYPNCTDWLKRETEGKKN